MKFTRPVPFEISDEVLREALGTAPRAAIDHYAYTFYRVGDRPPHSEIRVELVPINDIAPPMRDAGVAPFNADRLLSVLSGIATGDTLPAVLGQPTAPGAAHRIELVDGFHRFYVSAALGCARLPVAVRKRFEG
jgi:hypothetical protein